ncbi:MAG: 50S ribosome-binding GTPase [Chloroflexi bacterium]|nr:50S ribosome-binding GTPase [Chloroflexota bacterium]
MARGGIPVVAIVGRPNVGKSTLFNRFLGQRSAIVEDRARTTRDRLYGDTEWNGRRFVIVDTGGLELDPDDQIEARVQEQARLAARATCSTRSSGRCRPRARPNWRARRARRRPTRGLTRWPPVASSPTS